MTDSLHNEPPLYDLERFAEFEKLIEEFSDAASDYLKAGEVTTRQQAERLNDLISGSRDLFKRVETQRKADKEPWSRRATGVDTAFKPLKNRIESIANKLKPLQTAFLKKQQEEVDAKRREAEAAARAEREAAEKKMREAEANLNAAAMADAEAALKQAEKQEKEAAKQVKAKVGSHTGGGRSASLRTVRTATVVHVVKVALHYREDPRLLDALTAIVNQDLRAAKVDDSLIPGIAITEEQVAV